VSLARSIRFEFSKLAITCPSFTPFHSRSIWSTMFETAFQLTLHYKLIVKYYPVPCRKLNESNRIVPSYLSVHGYS